MLLFCRSDTAVLCSFRTVVELGNVNLKQCHILPCYPTCHYGISMLSKLQHYVLYTQEIIISCFQSIFHTRNALLSAWQKGNGMLHMNIIYNWPLNSMRVPTLSNIYDQKSFISGEFLYIHNCYKWVDVLSKQPPTKITGMCATFYQQSFHNVKCCRC